jgi:hypothetical protein
MIISTYLIAPIESLLSTVNVTHGINLNGCLEQAIDDFNTEQLMFADYTIDANRLPDPAGKGNIIRVDHGGSTYPYTSNGSSASQETIVLSSYASSQVMCQFNRDFASIAIESHLNNGALLFNGCDWLGQFTITSRSIPAIVSTPFDSFLSKANIILGVRNTGCHQ